MPYVCFSAMEAKSLFGALLLFFWHEFLGEFDCINVYSIGVFGGLGG